MAELCTDNRFELIEKYKKALIEGTNIETSSDEMKVIDNVLFRFWQMGWLEKLDTSDVQEVRHGKWVDIKIPANYSNEVQYQSAKCSVCKRYHTTPYLYMYYEHNYCPNCGARMDGGSDEQEERIHH